MSNRLFDICSYLPIGTILEVFRFRQRVQALAFRLDSSSGGALAYKREDAGSNPVQVMAKRLHELEFIAILVRNQRG